MAPTKPNFWADDASSMNNITKPYTAWIVRDPAASIKPVQWSQLPTRTTKDEMLTVRKLSMDQRHRDLMMAYIRGAA